MTRLRFHRRLRALRRVGPVLFLFCLGFNVVSSGPAAAETAANDARTRARSLADEAANAYAQREYAQAHELLGRAYRLVPAPTIALLDARALVELGRFLDAAAAYRLVLDAPLDASAPDAFRHAVDEAARELPLLERRIPRITIRLRGSLMRDERVRVVLDDRTLATQLLETAVPVDPRGHSIRLDIGAERGNVRTFIVAEGEAKTVTLDRPPNSSHAHRTWTLLAFGAAGSGILTGVIAGSVALNAHGDAQRACPEHRCEAGSRGASALEKFRTYRTLSTVGYGIGIAGLGAGTLLYFTRSERPSPSIAISATWNGVQVGGAL